MRQAAGWRLRLWEHSALLDPQGKVRRCEGKALALLVFLALEGPTPRVRLADLLWPDTGPASRNNLVVLLRRMNQMYGEPLYTAAGSLLSLGDRIQVVRVPSPPDAFPDDPAEAALDPLPGLDFPELTELNTWVDARRVSLRAEGAHAMLRAARALTQHGNHAGALPLLALAGRAQPISEEAARERMRAEYLSGDGPAALRTYERLRKALATQLNVEPVPLTQSLAREIGRAAEQMSHTFSPPMTASRSLEAPRLVGRVEECHVLESAWHAGQTTVITGEGGVGKSRLAQTFTHSCMVTRSAPAAFPAEQLTVQGRPGDEPVPYATLTRSLRALFAARPALPLSCAARRALGVLLPERFEPESVPAGDIGPALNAALREIHAALGDSVCTLMDDLHLMDAASAGVLLALTVERPARTIVCARADELSRPVTTLLDGLVHSGRARSLPLSPLTAVQSAELISSLARPELDALATQIIQLAGGRPLHLLEVARQVLSGEISLTADTASSGGHSEDVIARRVGTLSLEATQVARAAAVLAQDLRPEVLADMLGLPPLNVTAIWEELEQKNIVTEDRFTHDLVRSAVLERVPKVLLGLLHRAAARALIREGAPPTRLAAHWMAGERPGEATHALLEAGHSALPRGLYREAAAHFASAAELAGRAGERALGFAARRGQVEALYVLEDQVPEWQRGVDELGDYASTPSEQAQVQLQRARLHFALREEEEMAHAARTGLSLTERAGDKAIEAELLEVLAGYELHRDVHAAQLTLRRLNDLAQELRRPELQAWALEGLGFALLAATPSGADRLLQDAEALHLRTRPAPYAASATIKRGRAAFKLGDFPAALVHARRARQHLGDTEGFRVVHLIGAYGEALACWALGDRPGAAELLLARTTADPMVETTPAEAEWRAALKLTSLWLALDAGDITEAQQRSSWLREQSLPPTLQPEWLCALAAVHAATGTGDEALVTLNQALRAAQAQNDLYLTFRAEAQRAALLGDRSELRNLADGAGAHGLNGIWAALSGRAGPDPALALCLRSIRVS